MATNEFYYNDGVAITSEEAHALIDKSKLIVADREVLKAESDAILASNTTMEEETIQEEPQEEPVEEPVEEPIEEPVEETPEE